MIRRPPRSTLDRSSAASDVYKRQEARRRACRQRFFLLDAVRLDAVLSIRACRFAARDLQRLGLLPGAVGACGNRQGTLPLDPILCQRTPSGSLIRGFVLYGAGALPRTTRAGYTQAQVPVQEQTAQPGLDHHLAVPIVVSVGQVPPFERRRQGCLLYTSDAADERSSVD